MKKAVPLMTSIRISEVTVIIKNSVHNAWEPLLGPGPGEYAHPAASGRLIH